MPQTNVPTNTYHSVPELPFSNFEFSEEKKMKLGNHYKRKLQTFVFHQLEQNNQVPRLGRIFFFTLRERK